MIKPVPDQVRILDTTLRDGEQSPGATMTSAEKLELAKALSRLGVDVIEAGFPAASPDDLEAVRNIARDVGLVSIEGRPNLEPPIIQGLARATKSDIEKAWEAVRGAKHPRIHTFIATSDIHLEHKLRMSREQVLARVKEMVSYAKSFCEDIEYSPEDAGRSEPAFLYTVLEAAIEAGATTLNIPDTVGYTIPEEYGALIAGIVKNVRGIEKAIVSVHCHNDLGLATANALAGIRAGARQAEVTINGIGERAGNTALEELVMTLYTRQKLFGLSTHIDTTQITRVSKLVSNITGFVVQPNKAIVGANAFAHESGIHQDGMLKNADTYEIIKPDLVGAQHSQLTLGKLSGRHALRARLKDLGYALTDAELDKAFVRFKDLADKKKHIADADLRVLVADGTLQTQELFTLEALQVTSGTLGMPTATVKLRGPDGELLVHAALGTGPVDAAFKAINAMVKAPASLLEYAVRAVTEGIDALGEVTVRVQGDSHTTSANPQHGTDAPRTFGGHGADTDILVASVKAYLSALNKVLIATHPPAAP